ncbi:MAG: hypothetical protein M3P06_10305 [Acidobacteriota bacterium]|nr:hypothetical protein [Acidobacteriota bacterium]
MALISIVPAVRDLAQSTTKKFEITLTGVDCAKATEVFVVADGNDRTQMNATRNQSNPCRWHAEHSERPFPISRTRFSLRFRGARSGCRYAVEIPDEKLEPVGALTFVYSQNHARDLEIAIDSAKLHLTYLRHLPADETDQDSVECREHAWVKGTATLTDVLLDDETLHLYIGLAAKPLDAGWIRFDDALRQVILRDAGKNRSTKLGPDDLGGAIVREIARQETDAPPYVSGNEAQTLAAELRKKGFKNLQLKVKK